MTSAVDREPCPWRVVEDAGGAYVFGMVGGLVWHSVGGARNAPKGEVMRQMAYRVKTRVPIVAGSFAVWGVFFSCFDCTFSALRKKEDPWNAIMAGAATGGLLAIRAGLKAAGKNALVGGVILAAIEGLGLVIQRVLLPSIENSQGDLRRDILEPPLDLKRPYFKKTQISSFDRDDSVNTAMHDSSSLAFDDAVTGSNFGGKDAGVGEHDRKKGWLW